MILSVTQNTTRTSSDSWEQSLVKVRVAGSVYEWVGIVDISMDEDSLVCRLRFL